MISVSLKTVVFIDKNFTLGVAYYYFRVSKFNKKIPPLWNRNYILKASFQKLGFLQQHDKSRSVTLKEYQGHVNSDLK